MVASIAVGMMASVATGYTTLQLLRIKPRCDNVLRNFEQRLGKMRWAENERRQLTGELERLHVIFEKLDINSFEKPSETLVVDINLKSLRSEKKPKSKHRSERRSKSRSHAISLESRQVAEDEGVGIETAGIEKVPPMLMKVVSGKRSATDLSVKPEPVEISAVLKELPDDIGPRTVLPPVNEVKNESSGKPVRVLPPKVVKSSPNSDTGRPLPVKPTRVDTKKKVVSTETPQRRLKAFVQSSSQVFKPCYLSALRDGLSLEGAITLSVTVRPDGQIARARVRRARMRSRVPLCLAKKLSQLKISAWKAKKSMTVDVKIGLASDN